MATPHPFLATEHNLECFPLPVELISEIMLMLSPIDIHNFGSACKRFHRILEGHNDRVWHILMQRRDPPMPPIPHNMTATQYFNLAFAFKCSHCGISPAGTIIWEEAKRYCSGCRAQQRPEYAEDVFDSSGERLRGIVPWAWVDNALRPWPAAEADNESRFQITKLHHRPTLDLLLAETEGMNDDQFQAWYQTKRAEQGKIDQEIDAYIQWTRERVRRAFRQDVARIRVERVFSNIVFQSITSDEVDIPQEDFLMHPITTKFLKDHRSLGAYDGARGRDLLCRLYDQANIINGDWFITKTKALVYSIRKAFSDVGADSPNSDPTALIDISDFERCRSFLSLSTITFHCSSCRQTGYYPGVLSHPCRGKSKARRRRTRSSSQSEDDPDAPKPVPQWISGVDPGSLLRFDDNYSNFPLPPPSSASVSIATREVIIFDRPQERPSGIPYLGDREEIYYPFIEGALKLEPDVIEPPPSAVAFVRSDYDRAVEITRLCGLNPSKALPFDMAQVLLECKTCALLSMEDEDYRPVDAPNSALFQRPYFVNEKGAKGLKVFMTGQRAILHLAQNLTHKDGVPQTFEVVETEYQPLIDIDALSEAEVKQPNWKIRCTLCESTHNSLSQVLDHVQSHGVPKSMKWTSVVPTKLNTTVNRMTGFVPPLLVQRVVSRSFNKTRRR